MSNETPSPSPHTPTPWELSDVREFGLWKVIALRTKPNGDRWQKSICALLAGGEDEMEANFEFIVHAVNCHEALVAALKELLAHSGYTHMSDDELRYEQEQGNGLAIILLNARAALATADASRTSEERSRNNRRTVQRASEIDG